MTDPHNDFTSNPYAAPTATAGPPQSVLSGEFDATLAERSTRLGATLIDSVVMIGVVLVCMIPLFGVSASDKVGAFPVLLALLGFVVVAVGQAYLMSTAGQTIGKRAVGIRVVKLDGSPVGFGSGVALRSIVPAIVGAVPYVGWVFSLVDTLYIFGDSRRCLHDYIAGTKVIVTKAPWEAK